MSRAESATRQRIQDTARELFASRGVQRTSLQDIANALGITKPALYYHFASREQLVRSIVAPLIDEGEQFVRDHEIRGDAPVSDILAGYFDFHYRHRQDFMVLLTDLTTLSDLGFIENVLSWRGRLGKLLVGPDPDLERAVKAVLAIGGLQDCCLQFSDVPYEELRAATVDAALAALGM